MTAPDGEDYNIAAPTLAARLAAAAGEEVRLLQVGRGAFDSMPVSLVTTATGSRVGERFGRALDLRRFRANIVIAADGGGEAAWVGGSLRFGAREQTPRLRVNHRTERCVIPAIDPDSAAREPAIVRMLVDAFDNKIGAYCAVDAIGTIAVGDRVYLDG